MSENTVTDLADLGNLAEGVAVEAAVPAAEAPVRTGPAAPIRDKEIDAQGRAYATGRRKDACFPCGLKPGPGKYRCRTIKIGANVRTDLHADAREFARSIKERGVLEPVTVYADEDGAYVVLRGQRRTVVAAEVGLPDIPAQVVAKPERRQLH